MDHPPRAKLCKEEREEWSKEGIGDLKEIAGSDLVRVVAEERGPCPTVRTCGLCLAHVALNGSLRNLDADLPQLAPDALGTPQSVVGCHLLD